MGFDSQDDPGSAYVHLVAVAPRARRNKVASALYVHFASRAVERGQRCVWAVAAPTDFACLAFHRGQGFTVLASGWPDAPDARPDHDGPGRHRVVMRKDL